jgi:hypothetical protein
MVPSPRGIPAKGQRRSLQRWFKGLLAVMGSTGIFVLAMAGTAAYVLYQHVAEDLPEISLLNISPASLITTLDADDGSTMAHLFVERRLLVQGKVLHRTARAAGGSHTWQECTPAMAAGLRDHDWTMRELWRDQVPRAA